VHCLESFASDSSYYTQLNLASPALCENANLLTQIQALYLPYQLKNAIFQNSPFGPPLYQLLVKFEELSYLFHKQHLFFAMCCIPITAVSTCFFIVLLLCLLRIAVDFDINHQGFHPI